MGYTYQILFCHTNLQSYFLDFTQTPADFAGTEVGLLFSSNMTSSYFFLQKSFLDLQHVISSLNFDH
jgi:hypothetical protein